VIAETWSTRVIACGPRMYVWTFMTSMLSGSAGRPCSSLTINWPTDAALRAGGLSRRSAHAARFSVAPVWPSREDSAPRAQFFRQRAEHGSLRRGDEGLFTGRGFDRADIASLPVL